MKVAKVKTGLDAMGKDLTTKWKDQAKKVDGSRKSMREALDSLKVEGVSTYQELIDDLLNHVTKILNNARPIMPEIRNMSGEDLIWNFREHEG